MPGERFTVVIDYDPVVYSKGVVHALFERRESDGFSVCLESATTYETKDFKEGGDSFCIMLCGHASGNSRQCCCLHHRRESK
jgi:hypothetical protein